ncbi:MAG: DUF5683 domain-containing protein [Fidelibacterota bacterium]
MVVRSRHCTGGIVLAVVFLASLTCARGSDSVAVEKSPSRAALYSMLLPGAGQVYNRKYVKALLIFAAQATMAYQFYRNLKIYGEWDPETYELPQFRYREKRNKYAWWTAFVYIYNILDALVDSHLSSFDEDEFEGIEPLPEEEVSPESVIRHRKDA